MGAPSVAACALILAICLPAVCQGQQYWGGYGWRPVWQPSVSAVCERAYPVDEQSASVRTSCRYPCKGWPVRYGDEEDGTPCQLSWWRQGFCFRGRCQRQYLVPAVPGDENNNVEVRQEPVRVLVCRNRRERLKFPGVVRSCQFVCKQRRSAFLANEENGTPCLAFGGNVGFCDQGVCKAVEATAAPTTAPTAPPEASTTTSLPVESAVTTAAPAATAAATEEDVSVAETNEPTPVATTQAPVTAAPVARPPWRPGFVGVKCDRAYPARVNNGRMAKCRFLCRGYPFLRIGFEEDGTPCWRKKTIEGVCFDGKCEPVPPPTEATTVEQESSTAGPSAAQTDEVVTMGAGDETTTPAATGTETAENLSTSTTSIPQEGDDASTDQGTNNEGAESTTAKLESATSEQQEGSEEQATTANPSRGADDEGHTEENASEGATTATHVEYGTTEGSGHLADEDAAAQEQTTGPSPAESTTVQSDATDAAASGQAGTSSGEQATTQTEQEGSEGQQTTGAGPTTGEEEEEGSGHTVEQAASETPTQELTTGSSSTEEAIAAVSETDAAIEDASTQSSHESTAGGSVDLVTEEGQASEPSVKPGASETGTDAGGLEDNTSSSTEAEQQAEGTTSAATQTEAAEPEGASATSSTRAADVEPPTESPLTSDAGQELTDGQALASTDGAFETTTTASESETAKVITTVTRKEIVRPVGSDDMSEATVVDTTRNTYVETIPVSALNETGNPNKQKTDVSDSSDTSGTADETNEEAQGSSTDGALSEGDTTTDFAADVAQSEQVVTGQPEQKEASAFDETSQGTTHVETSPLSKVDEQSVAAAETTTSSEEALQAVQEGTEVSSVAVAEEFPESTTGATAPESATVKVVTKVIQKEIVRPVGSDSQSDATVVDVSKTTSVETLPASEFGNAEESGVVASSESTVSVNDDAAANDVVSSGPSIVITDFVQKTASSSKEPVTAPSTEGEATELP